MKPNPKQNLIIVLIIVLINSAAFGQNNNNARFQADSIDGVYIPMNLEDCFKQIDSFLDDSTKLKIKQWTEDEFMGNAHMGFGMWMRNNWGLWKGSRLSNYFNEMGVFHPDDMSGIILATYHRYLLGKPLNVQQQTELYQLWWKVGMIPSKDMYPAGVKRLEFNRSMLYHLKENNDPGRIHIQTNSKSDKVWVYDYYFGWKLLTAEELQQLEQSTIENREEIIRALYAK